MVNPGATTILDMAASYGIGGRSSVNDDLLRHKCDSPDLPPSCPSMRIRRQWWTGDSDLLSDLHSPSRRGSNPRKTPTDMFPWFSDGGC
nr:hypothetical protein Itr_chr10CG14710 [Ipomoea trifida]